MEFGLWEELALELQFLAAIRLLGAGCESYVDAQLFTECFPTGVVNWVPLSDTMSSGRP